MSNLINVAIVGYGAGGRFFNAQIAAAVENLFIKKILTSSPKNIEFATTDFPRAKVVDNYDKILEDKEIELVIVTTPNHLHKTFAEKALRAGKHVVVEKPFTPSVQEAEELIDLAQEQGLILSVNHNRRWDSDIRTIKKILDENRLGKVVEYEAHFDRFRPEVKQNWKEEKELAGSGILYDLGSHLIDQALLLFGKPLEIFADLRTQRENSEVVDNFELLLFYPELKVTLKAGMLVKEPGPRYQIFGRNGSFLKWGIDVQEEALKNGARPDSELNWGEEPREIWGRINTQEETGLIKSARGDYRNFYKNIYNAIRGKEPLEVTARQASDVIRIIELAEQSHQEKRIISF